MKSGSIKLEGDIEPAFEAIRAHMKSLVPGINPNNAEVLRAAVFMAAGQVPVKHHPDMANQEKEANING